jgi:hypothetical protein
MKHAQPLTLFLSLLLTACHDPAKAKREKERQQSRLEIAMTESHREAAKELIWVTDPKDPRLDRVEAALRKSESIERELRALGALRASAKTGSRATQALRLIVAGHRAGPGKESDRLRQQAADILDGAKGMPATAEETKH